MRSGAHVGGIVADGGLDGLQRAPVATVVDALGIQRSRRLPGLERDGYPQLDRTIKAYKLTGMSLFFVTHVVVAALVFGFGPVPALGAMARP